MKTFLVILICAAVVAIVFFRTTKLRRAFALEAQKLSDKELEEAILDLWEETGEHFSLSLSFKLDIFEKESRRRMPMLSGLL